MSGIGSIRRLTGSRIHLAGTIPAASRRACGGAFHIYVVRGDPGPTLVSVTSEGWGALPQASYCEVFGTHPIEAKGDLATQCYSDCDLPHRSHAYTMLGFSCPLATHLAKHDVAQTDAENRGPLRSLLQEPAFRLVGA